MATINRRRLLLLVGAMGVAGAATQGARLFAQHAKASDENVIKMTVKRFEYSPRELHLKKGVPVTLEITSIDVMHGFNLPDFNVRADVIPGKPALVQLKPDRTGSFTFRCDVFCGTGHEDLDGTLIVTA